MKDERFHFLARFAVLLFTSYGNQCFVIPLFQFRALNNCTFVANVVFSEEGLLVNIGLCPFNDLNFINYSLLCVNIDIG